MPDRRPSPRQLVHPEPEYLSPHLGTTSDAGVVDTARERHARFAIHRRQSNRWRRAGIRLTPSGHSGVATWSVSLD